MQSLRLPVLLSLGTLACGDDAGTGDESSTSTSTTATSTSSSTSSSSGSGGEGGGTTIVDIPFAAEVGDVAFDCAQEYDGIGTTNATVSITDFRFYVHDVRLMRADGEAVALELEQDGLWQYENLALLDFENDSGACSNGTSQTRTVVRGAVPVGAYVGLSFRLGVPAELNHLNAAKAPSPLNLSALFWAWTSGYKYLRVDSIATGAAGPFNLHLGAGECTGDPGMGVDGHLDPKKSRAISPARRGRPRGVAHRRFLGALPRFSRRSLSRQESASTSRTWQCWAKRSTRAPRQGASPKTVVHCL